MKTKSIICGLLASVTLGFTTSCEDMLTANSDRHSYETAQDTLYSYWGVLKTLQNIGERYVILGEARGDLVSPTAFTSDTIAAIANFRNPQDGDCRYLQASDFYAVINNCNAYLASADTIRPIYGANAGDNDRYMMREYAQVWTIRAWTYMQLVQLYDEVPFYTHPLMSTAEVEDFYNGGNCVKANRHNLAQLIEDEAGAQLQNIIMQDYPRYGMYNSMVHSHFCYFPTQVVLGDLWLMAAQSQAEYEKAAQYYFNYIDRFQAVLPTNYYCTAFELSGGSRGNLVSYSYSGAYDIYDVSSINSVGDINNEETITVIPSTTNKLWGTIQRGVNDVFGYTSDVSVSTSATDTTTSATVVLSPSSEPQLVASNAFSSLCRSYPALAQKVEKQGNSYEVVGYDTIETGADARRAWSQMTRFTDNGQVQNVELIHKQNPYGTFSTTYPVVYRKAHVWLRLAEAINRAGFPEYAYAILADGLSEELTPYVSATTSNYNSYYYLLRDTAQAIVAPYASEADMLAGIAKDPDRYVDSLNIYHFIEKSDIILYSDGCKSATLDTLDIPANFYEKCMAQGIYVSKQNTSSEAIWSGSYIPYNQALKATTKPYMQFQKKTFSVINSSNGGNGLNLNHGVHGRSHCMSIKAGSSVMIGGGNILPTFCETRPSDDDRTRDSVMNRFYNFDVNVKSKWAGYPGRLNYYAVDAAAYEAYQQQLIEAVEELILDEMGMELCFEGNRFNDLVRIAERRNDPSFLATKVANRSGELNSELYGKLMNKQNWFLQLPR